MSPIKRAFPLPVWLTAFSLLLAVFLTGLWMLAQEAAPAVSPADISLLFRAGWYNPFLSGFELALQATLLTFILGYPAGCMLAMWRRRTVFMSFLIPAFSLAGIALLYGSRLLPLLPDGLKFPILSAASRYAAPYESITVILLPIMILCACSFAMAMDPALPRAARCLGATRLRAFLTLTIPRMLKGVPASLVTAFLPALGFAHLSNQRPETSAGVAIPVYAVLFLLTAVIIAVSLFILKKARSVSPC